MSITEMQEGKIYHIRDRILGQPEYIKITKRGPKSAYAIQYEYIFNGNEQTSYFGDTVWEILAELSNEEYKKVLIKQKLKDLI